MRLSDWVHCDRQSHREAWHPGTSRSSSAPQRLISALSLPQYLPSSDPSGSVGGTSSQLSQDGVRCLGRGGTAGTWAEAGHPGAGQSFQSWVEAGLGGLQTLWPPSSMGLCAIGRRGPSPGYMQTPPTPLSYLGLCVAPHLGHSITHHTIPHLASPLSGPPWAGPGVPLGSEAPKFLWGCMHFCINLPSMGPSRIHTGSEQSLAEGAGGWGGVTSK